MALIGTAFFAICPWHIMKSRWGMECNLFPDLILLSVLLLSLGIKNKNNKLYVLGFIFLAISSYSYATSYLFLPVFVLGILGYLIYIKETDWKRATIYLSIMFFNMCSNNYLRYNKYFRFKSNKDIWNNYSKDDI